MAQRLWTPFDMVGVSGVSMMRGQTNVAAVAPVANGSPVNTISAQRLSGTADTAQSFRDDFRPVINTVNGLQTVSFDTATRQLQIATPGNLPSGTGSKGWCFAGFIRETRTDDRYTWGYGSGNQQGVAYKMRQGAVPYSDVGSTGYAIGSIPIAATGLSVIVEAYNGATATSRANLNGNATFSEYAKARNTSATNARLGSWPLYGNGSAHDFGYLIWWTAGDATTDDLLRLAAFCSWDSGEAGAGLHASNPWKAAPPMIDDGTGGVSASGAAVLGAFATTATAALKIAGSAALALAPLTVGGNASSPTSGVGAQVLAPVAAAGAAGSFVSAAAVAALSPIAGAGAATVSAASSGAPMLPPITGGGTGSAAPIVSAQGSATLAGLSATGFGSALIAGSAIGALARVAGTGAGTIGTGATAMSLLRPATSAGLASALIVGRGGGDLPAPSLVTRASSPIGGTGAASLAPVVGAGTGSPPTPPIVVPPSRRFTLASAGSRRATLTSSGSRRLTI